MEFFDKTVILGAYIYSTVTIFFLIYGFFKIKVYIDQKEFELRKKMFESQGIEMHAHVEHWHRPTQQASHDQL